MTKKKKTKPEARKAVKSVALEAPKKREFKWRPHSPEARLQIVSVLNHGGSLDFQQDFIEAVVKQMGGTITWK